MLCIYLEHLWRTTGPPGRQPWPETALSSCLALKGQQRIKKSADNNKKDICTSQLTFTLWCKGISFTPNVELRLKRDLRAFTIRQRARSSPWIVFL